MAEKPLLTIGQLARRTGVPVRTIRFWSDEGVLPETDRSSGNYRRYDGRAVARLDLVRTLRELGMGLDDIRLVLERRRSVEDVAAAHVQAIDHQIRVLRTQRAVCTLLSRGAPSRTEGSTDERPCPALRRRAPADDRRVRRRHVRRHRPRRPWRRDREQHADAPDRTARRTDHRAGGGVGGARRARRTIRRSALGRGRWPSPVRRPAATSRSSTRHRSSSTRAPPSPPAPHPARPRPRPSSPGSSSPVWTRPRATSWPTRSTPSPTAGWRATGTCSASSTAGGAARRRSEPFEWFIEALRAHS